VQLLAAADSPHQIAMKIHKDKISARRAVDLMFPFMKLEVHLKSLSSICQALRNVFGAQKAVSTPEICGNP
jgi:hypothetical protein